MGGLLGRQGSDVADDEHQHADADERDDPHRAAAREVDESSLTTAAPSKAAPTIHGSRAARVAASHIVASAITVQSKVMPVCTASEASQASTWYGTPA